MARPKTSLRKTRQMLNRLTLALVSALGFLSVASILTAPSTITPSMGEDVTLRGPASIDIGSTLRVEKHGIEVVKLTCEPEMKLSQDSSQIRIRGKVCAEGPVTIEKSVIKNSEKQDVTVFHKEKTFTTDVIHLRQGTNKLVITNTLSDGSTNTQILLVERPIKKTIN